MGRARIVGIVAALFILPTLAILFLLHILYPFLHSEYRLEDLGPDFRHIENPNVHLFTNVPGREVEKVAALLSKFYEKFFSEFGEDFSIRKMEGYIEFAVFQTVEELHKHFQKKHGRDPFNMRGYYDPALRLIAIPWEGGKENRIETVLHEGTHLIFDQFAGANSPFWSLWFSEGLACYFGSSRLTGNAFVLGGYEPIFLKIFKSARESGEGVTVLQLLEAPRRSFQEEGNLLLYAASQLLVYYLMEGEGGRFRKPFFRYYRLERQPGPCGVQDFKSVFGNDLKKFDARWMIFLDRLR